MGQIQINMSNLYILNNKIIVTIFQYPLISIDAPPSLFKLSNSYFFNNSEISSIIYFSSTPETLFIDNSYADSKTGFISSLIVVSSTSLNPTLSLDCFTIVQNKLSLTIILIISLVVITIILVAIALVAWFFKRKANKYEERLKLSKNIMVDFG